MRKLQRTLVFPFSTKEALRGAAERQKNLEAEVKRVTQQMKEEMDKVIRQKEEEIKGVRKGLEEHQQKSREENERCVLNSHSVCFEIPATSFFFFNIPFFLDLIDCW